MRGALQRRFQRGLYLQAVKDPVVFLAADVAEALVRGDYHGAQRDGVQRNAVELHLLSQRLLVGALPADAALEERLPHDRQVGLKIAREFLPRKALLLFLYAARDGLVQQLGKLLGVHRLYDVFLHAGLHSADGVIEADVAGDEYNVELRTLFTHLARKVKPACVRQNDIGDDDIRPQPLLQLLQLQRVLGAAGHRHSVLLPVYRVFQQRKIARLIVGKQNL